jgi:hypothetical protein
MSKRLSNFIASKGTKKTALAPGMKTGPMVKRIDGEGRNRNDPKGSKNLVDLSSKNKKHYVG